MARTVYLRAARPQDVGGRAVLKRSISYPDNCGLGWEIGGLETVFLPHFRTARRGPTSW
jgi:hypothetical protein